LRPRLPAIKGRTTCKTHGGKSTGARTPLGKAKAAADRTVHGREIKEERAARRETLRQLEGFEALGRELGMITGPRGSGRRVKRA
jgi:hypothetical protein